MATPKPEVPSPNPDKITPLIAKWATILGTIGGVAAWLLSTGVLDSVADQYPWLLQIVTAAAAIGGAVTGGRLARRKVTPVDNPLVQIAGQLVRLVPEESVHQPPPKDTRNPGVQSRISKDRPV